MTGPPLPATTDGLVTIRAPEPGDADVLVAGRDEEFHRFLGPGADQPRPTGCVLVAGRVAGWVDYDRDQGWLLTGEVNLGYNVFAAYRGSGYATRAVRLLLHHLALRTSHRTATLLIDPANDRSLALAARLGAARAAHPDGAYFKLAVPPLSYSDGIVTIRRLRPDDLDADLAAKDDEQIRWMWLPGQRDTWEAMTDAARRAHAAASLRQRIEAFGAGPSWAFAADAPGASYAVYVECDLASGNAPAGEANISYSCHPAYRGHGYVSRAVRLISCFLHDHTGARQAHLLIDPDNAASLRVALAVGARRRGQSVNESGQLMVRHVLALGDQRAGA